MDQTQCLVVSIISANMPHTQFLVRCYVYYKVFEVITRHFVKQTEWSQKNIRFTNCWKNISSSDVGRLFPIVFGTLGYNPCYIIFFKNIRRPDLNNNDAI